MATFAPSRISLAQMYKCGKQSFQVLDGSYELKKEKSLLEMLRGLAGEIFEKQVYKELPTLDNSIKEKLKWADICESIDEDVNEPLDEILDEFISYFKEKDDGTYLIYNPGNPHKKLKPGIALRTYPAKSFIENSLEEIIGEHQYKIEKEDIVYMDLLFVEKIGNEIIFRVGEIKFSDKVQDYHKFQAVLYQIILNELSKIKKTFKVDKNLLLITKGIGELAYIDNVKVASFKEVFKVYLELLIIRGLEQSGLISPLNSKCQSCSNFEECKEEAFKEKSIFLYKSLRRLYEFLYEEKYDVVSKVVKDLRNLQLKPDKASFLAEVELVDKYGFAFLNDFPKVKKVRDLSLSLLKRKVYIFINPIKHPSHSGPIAISLGILIDSSLKNILDELNLKGTKLKNNYLYLMFFYSYEELFFTYNVFRNIFYEILTRIQRAGINSWDIFLFFLEAADKEIIIYDIKKYLYDKLGTLSSRAIYFFEKIYNTLSMEDSLVLHKNRENGLVLSTFLPFVYATNEPFANKLSGIRAINLEEKKPEISKILVNSIECKKYIPGRPYADRVIIPYTFSYDDQKSVELTKEFGDLFSSGADLNAIMEKYFSNNGKLIDNISPYATFRPGTNINDLCEFSSSLTYECLRLIGG